MTKTVIANWKMNLTLAESLALAQAVVGYAPDYPTLRLIIAPSLVWLAPLAEAVSYRPSNFFLASQVVSPHPEGAYTGDVSARQLKGLVQYGLVGHSERRRYHHETALEISGQITELAAVGITPVICFGEMSQGEGNRPPPAVTAALGQDLASLPGEVIGQCLLAYEPLWAIGTGTRATTGYIRKAVKGFKTWFGQTLGVTPPMIYGGSITAENAGELGAINELDGLLVGGASLDAQTLAAICRAFSRQV